MNWKKFTDEIDNSGLIISSAEETGKTPLAIEVNITAENLTTWLTILNLPAFYTTVELRNHFRSVLKGKNPSTEETFKFKLYKKDYPIP